jgi:SAM-dependent methyltransferase
VTRSPTCRLCGAALSLSLVDLGEMPLANRLLTEDELARPELRYPLHARVCTSCFLVQVESVVPPQEIFGDYSYFSSYSSSWVEHARRFAHAAAERFGLDGRSHVIEVASNDGYLLRHFVALGIPCLGVEPAANVAAVAREAGVPTEARFFGTATAADLVAHGLAADLLVANNVLAHVPDLNDFIRGLATALKPGGVLSVEFPHLLNLLRETQFDTIYHEHFSYFSLGVVQRAFRRRGLEVFDVEELPTHGGSLRVYAARTDSPRQPTTNARQVLAAESAAGLDAAPAYADFGLRVERIRRDLLSFLREAKAGQRSVVAYGAAAKGATLLNYCGIGPELISFVVDRSPHKQGRYMPGCRLPIRDPQEVRAAHPSYLLILPWNLRDEIMQEMQDIREWGGKFAVAVPRLEIMP